MQRLTLTAVVVVLFILSGCGDQSAAVCPGETLCDADTSDETGDMSQSTDGDEDEPGDLDADMPDENDLAVEENTTTDGDDLPDEEQDAQTGEEDPDNEPQEAADETPVEIEEETPQESEETDEEYVQPAVFDMDMIRDASTAQCTFFNHHTVWKDLTQFDVWNVTYLSWESINGQLSPILIRAFAAKPSSLTDDIPGVVMAHGLGGNAEEDNAVDNAALTGMFVIAYTGPGGGDTPENTSEGRSAGYENGYRLFDTIPDVRGSWFWGHAVAAMRAFTCLTTRPEIDADRLGMTGYSAGGVVTMISASVDDRIKAAVPLSGTLGWDISVQAPNAWQHQLLLKAGLTADSEQWQRLMQYIVTPGVLLPQTNAKVFMINGSTDEFFPLTAHMACFNAVPGDDKRTSLTANYDHGCYELAGVESPQVVEDRADIRYSGGLRMWMRHWFDTDDDYQHLPQAPQMVLTPVAGGVYIVAMVDELGQRLSVDSVRFWASNDDSYIFASVELEHSSNGVFTGVVPFTQQANTVFYLDVQYRTEDLLFPERFSISSPPQVPEGLIPHIRSMSTCL